MRFLIVLILILLLAYKLWPDRPVPAAEESFIGPQIQSLEKAERLEQQYLDALDKADEKIEQDSGGG
jgi:hypothetical protein